MVLGREQHPIFRQVLFLLATTVREYDDATIIDLVGPLIISERKSFGASPFVGFGKGGHVHV